MKKMAIIGNGSYARRLKKYIELSHYGQICAYVTEPKYMKDDVLLDGIKSITFDAFERKMKPTDVELVLGIGYSQMGDVRKRIFNIYMEKGYSFINYVHPSAILSPDIEMGQGNIILEGVIIEPNVSIGNANLMFSGSTVGHDSVLGSYNTLCGKVLISSQNKVGDNCYFGDCSVLSPGIKAEDYVLMGTMTHSNKNLSQGTVVMPSKSKVIEGKKSKVYFQMFVR